MSISQTFSIYKFLPNLISFLKRVNSDRTIYENCAEYRCTKYKQNERIRNPKVYDIFIK